MKNKNTIVVIPCYNEAQRLKTDSYLRSLKNLPELAVIFVNDGSKDNTLEKLKSLADLLPDQISVLNLDKNGGKAQAVFHGVQLALSEKPEYVGYIDADLAVSLEEFQRLLSHAKNNQKRFVFGSRWKRIGSKIERKLFRHAVGRVFSTIASNLLDLGVYDTQCGAKVFDAKTAAFVFDKPFHVNWVFDVEIFFRLLEIFPRENIDQYVSEVPLGEWIDVAGSKVKMSHSINIFKDFITLNNKYRSGKKVI